MLLWEFLFIFLVLTSFWSFIFSVNNLLSLLFASELVIATLFSWFLIVSVFFSVNSLFALAYLLLIFGGLEISLSVLILLI